MPQLVKKRRSGWAVLAAGALIASLLAVGSAPAGADTDEADHAATTVACVGDALGDQMFTDVVDEHAFKNAINCIAYYGITNGNGDGSTFAPNKNVTRAEMAVFIARAAVAAGVDLGAATSAGFSDIGDIWQEAQDAINRLGNKGMIPKGGAFRPGDAITRAEMATFLVGLLVQAASNVSKNAAGAILLGSGTGIEADDYFPDSRATLPRANDNEVSALYELGVTKGASAAAVQDDTKPPLDFNYNPSGTVNRGQMAEFITRALAHTSVRPAGISAQHNGTHVVLSSRDADFQPMENVIIDVFSTDTNGVDLAFKADGTCGEVDRLGAAGSESGTYVCEIDGADPLTDIETATRIDGDVSVGLTDIEDGGTTVWAWTGKVKDKVNSDTVLYRLDIPESAVVRKATRVRVSTDFAGAKVHLGSSVLYTVQLEDANGPVTVGTDGKKPAKVLVRLSTYAVLPDSDQVSNPGDYDRKAAAPVVSTIPLTTDSDGKATFSVSGLPDQAPTSKADKYAVDVQIEAVYGSNAPGAPTTPLGTGTSAFYIGTATTATDATATTGSTGLAPVKVAASDEDYSAAVVFSTEASDHNQGVVSVKVASDYLVASTRGVSTRATVTVVDQYADPIAGAEVSLATSGAGSERTIAGGQTRATGSNGSYTFGYEYTAAAVTTTATELLTASWDHDADTDTAAKQGTDTVEWATVATTANNATSGGTAITFIDKENNVIFTGSAGSTIMVRYDSNDRFDVEAAGEDTSKATTYAKFEKALSTTHQLKWTINGNGSRDVNNFTLDRQS